MPKYNEYVNLNKPKSVEIVHELKGDEYKIPSFEEFMKDYQVDEKVNYADLESGDIGSSKGYGPCNKCENSKSFKLAIVLRNFLGSIKSMTVYNVDDAREEARKILQESGHWGENAINWFSSEDRQKLVDRINSAIYRHVNCNEDVNKVVCNKD